MINYELWIFAFRTNMIYFAMWIFGFKGAASYENLRRDYTSGYLFYRIFTRSGLFFCVCFANSASCSGVR
jgi:hypothetical protein